MYRSVYKDGAFLAHLGEGFSSLCICWILYIFWMQIHLPVVGPMCILSTLLVFFFLLMSNDETFLILMSFNLPIFFFTVSALSVFFKKNAWLPKGYKNILLSCKRSFISS